MRRDRIRPFLPADARSGLGRVPRRVGLLGGSFNPAHDGHRQISLAALQRLRLDEVWWLVSPQNPLKATRDMAPLARRMAKAQRLVAGAPIRVSDVERMLRTRYTVDTVAALRLLYPATHFVWLMGADNLAQMSRWKRWPDLCRLVPFAVLDRPGSGARALAGAVARRYARQRLDERAARQLVCAAPPRWSFVHSRLNPLSGTALRAAPSKR
ncbi:MAG TPA: nicotinate-nucleotide adenylyltransferase [Vineibacter sp.]|nr:nicotinate-nucleotide adenylyltransferase [Vineibacter sp.]